MLLSGLDLTAGMMMSMIQAFYKTKPQQDTPYRQLSLTHENGWRVCLSTGKKWGRENAQELKVTLAASFDEANLLYDTLFEELQNEGWKAYTPHEIW
jgi:hypothetical protein